MCKVNFFEKWSDDMAYVLGYFVADGNVNFGVYRKASSGKRSILITRFTAEKREFLAQFLLLLRCYAQLKGGSIYKNSRGYHLNFSIRDSIRLFYFMYEEVPAEKYLERKHKIYYNALKHWGRSSAGLERMPVTHEVAGSNPVAPARRYATLNLCKG